MTFWELNEYFKGRSIEWQRSMERSRMIVAALVGKSPVEIVRLPDIDGDVERIDWTPELAENVLKHFGEWQT